MAGFIMVFSDLFLIILHIFGLTQMNVEQEQACTQLFRALNQCNKVGLEGGVYESRFCIWPKEVTPQETNNFFETIELFGEVLPSPMCLDGGAGV